MPLCISKGLDYIFIFAFAKSWALYFPFRKTLLLRNTVVSQVVSEPSPGVPGAWLLIGSGSLTLGFPAIHPVYCCESPRSDTIQMLLPYIKEPATGSRMPSRQSPKFPWGLDYIIIPEGCRTLMSYYVKSASHRLVSSGSAHA